MLTRLGRRAGLFFLLMLIATLSRAADIQVSVSRNPVAMNESFQIVFSAEDEPDGEPDFGPLRDHFEILNQQRSSSSSWVNGKSSRNEQWILNAMAKQAGELLIPPIRFGADSSRPLKIVVSASAVDPQQDGDLFLEVTATPEKPYVQSQVIYTLKLFRRVQITQASLGEPEIKDALVEKLGEDDSYTTQVDGVDYWVTERKYAIFPQQSGLFTIAPLTLNAEVVAGGRPRFNGFFNRPSTETRRVTSKPVTLNVLPVPAGFAGNWLSAEHLELREQWSDPGRHAKVGEPLTRTITLTARGATVGQLPELTDKAAIDGVKSYPDQPLLKEDKLTDGLTALREEKVALIPSKPGRYTLPPLEIPWFNTRTGKIESARLPAATIIAEAGAGETAPTGSQPQTSADATMPMMRVETVVASDSELRFWRAATVVCALGWLATGIWAWRRRAGAVAENRVKPVPAGESSLERNLKRACWENNPQAAKQCLLQWGRQRFGTDSLSGLADQRSAMLAEEIEALNRLLYSGGEADWQGRALWEAFIAESPAAPVQSGVDDGLEPLFKIRD
ncbi:MULTISPECIES: BatD family protein [Methylomonas]|uniref:DUF7939 domain-containing protein n=1 Tax=Methylomonas koyamae TaxID=702114 RepID=A0A177P2L3_9GAMM|nr:BatD family protein [Methylomonas koyamae]OAI24451.1 hypothetical protein A1355_20615 [Methylomonas koyamae]